MLCAYCLQGVISLGSLSAQHDAVGSVQHGVGYVTALSTGRSGLLDHALQHLNGVGRQQTQINKPQNNSGDKLTTEWYKQNECYMKYSMTSALIWPEWRMWSACQLCCSDRSSSSGLGRPFLWGSQYPGHHGQPWCHRWPPWSHQICTEDKKLRSNHKLKLQVIIWG